MTVETIAKGLARGNAWATMTRTRFKTITRFESVGDKGISLEDIGEEVNAEITEETVEEEWFDVEEEGI